MTKTNTNFFRLLIILSLMIAGVGFSQPASPNLLLPSDSATGVSTSPTLTWEVVPSALSYHLLVDTSASFASPIVDTAGMLSTSFIPASALKNITVYYWKVSAVDLGGASAFSSRSFTTVGVTPSLSHPVGGQLVYGLTPTLYWYISIPVTGIKYDVLISKDVAFPGGATTVYDADSLFNFTVTSALTPGSKYYWQVRSKYSAGVFVNYSAVDSFVTYGSAMVPTITYPIGGQIVYAANPTISWVMTQQVPFYTYEYRYKATTDGAWSATVNTGANVSDSLVGLSLGKTYLLEVRSYNGDSYSNWSAPDTFNTVPVPSVVTPTVAYPSGGVTVYTSAPTLNWYTGVSNAGLTFAVEVRTDSNFTGTPTHSGISDMYFALSGLTAGNTYYWQVRTSNGTSNSAWSSYGSFIVESAPVVSLAESQLLVPLDSATVTNPQTLLVWAPSSWNPSTVYDVEYSLDSTFAISNGGTGLTDAFHLTNSLLAGKTYFWRVRIFDGSSYSAWIGPHRFFTAGSAGSLVPVLIWPTGGTLVNDTTETLLWYVNTVSVADLTFQIGYQSLTGDTTTTYISDVASTNLTLVGLTAGSLYSYRIRTYNGNAYSAWSESETFSTPAGVGPLAPMIGGPNNFVPVNSVKPVLSWYLPVKNAKAQSYEVVYSTKPDFSNAQTVSNISAKNQSITVDNSNKVYYWKVRSKSVDGSYSGFSALGKFIAMNVTGVEQNNSSLPKQFSLEQNYPNPFNPSTVIKFALPKESRVTLRVFNVLGKEVSLLINSEMKNAGNHEVSFNASRLSSGVYFYTIEANNITLSRKMVILK